MHRLTRALHFSHHCLGRKTEKWRRQWSVTYWGHGLPPKVMPPWEWGPVPQVPIIKVFPLLPSETDRWERIRRKNRCPDNFVTPCKVGICHGPYQLWPGSYQLLEAEVNNLRGLPYQLWNQQYQLESAIPTSDTKLHPCPVKKKKTHAHTHCRFNFWAKRMYIYSILRVEVFIFSKPHVLNLCFDQFTWRESLSFIVFAKIALTD